MNGTLMVLDDDVAVLELTSLYLKSRGFSTVTCASAQSALEQMREAGCAGSAVQIDVLIADVTLADGSGVDVAVRLKELAPQLKILFVSGYALDELSDPDSALYRLLPRDSVRFLRKPYCARELIAGILELAGYGNLSLPAAPT